MRNRIGGRSSLIDGIVQLTSVPDSGDVTNHEIGGIVIRMVSGVTSDSWPKPATVRKTPVA